MNIIYRPTWEDIIEDMRSTPDNYKHPDSTGGGIGVGTDKEPVNMDLWTYSKSSDGTYQIGEYKGNVTDGKIEGCIPQYVYDPDEKISKPVTALAKTFPYKSSILTQPVIPDTVTRLDDNAFAGSKLKTITIPNSVTYIGYQCFTSAMIEEIVLPDSITEIGGYAFSSCKTLKTITLSNNLKSIGFLTFMSCDSLESIIIPSSITNIDSGAFPYCNNLKDIYIRKSENSIKSAPWSASNATLHWNYPE